MNLIYKTKFGSFLYGTNVAASDEDYKGVYIPEPRDIILQRTKKVIQLNQKLSTGTKNQAGDQDYEVFSFQEFMKLLLEGQTVALDMLFSMYNHPGPINSDMAQVLYYKEKFLHKGTAAYTGYCRTQAAKYGLKGGRVAAIKAAIEFLNTKNWDFRLGDCWDQITLLANTTEHMKIEVIEGPNGQMLPYWNVCDRKMGQTTNIKYALDVFTKIYDQYGHRAKLAEKNENVDWKALLHAVRVCEEAKELLLTGHITFPRPEAPLLLSIRNQELPYKQVAEIIEQGLIDVEAAKVASTLPEAPDKNFADELVYNLYKRIIQS